MKFNSVVFDCEGCYVKIIEQYRKRLQTVDKVMYKFVLDIQLDVLKYLLFSDTYIIVLFGLNSFPPSSLNTCLAMISKVIICYAPDLPPSPEVSDNLY